jgi:hypothetical protein
VLAPGGLLFCVIFPDVGGNDVDEIIALDAQTLQLRRRFGLGLLNDANQLAVAGDELYACKSSLSLGSTAALSRVSGGHLLRFAV